MMVTRPFAIALVDNGGGSIGWQFGRLYGYVFWRTAIRVLLRDRRWVNPFTIGLEARD